MISRELLVECQEAVMFMSGQFVSAGARRRYDDLQKIIDELDAENSTNVHGEFHTLTCGCFPNSPTVNRIMEGARYSPISKENDHEIHKPLKIMLDGRWRTLIIVQNTGEV